MSALEYARGLRQLAEVYEHNPDIVLPYEGVGSALWIFTWSAEDFARTVAAFGGGNKRFDDTALLFLPDVGGLNIQIRCEREQICERRVVGKKRVEEKIVPAQIIPAHDEDIVEWDCKPILAKKPAATVEVQPALEAAAETPLTAVEIPF